MIDRRADISQSGKVLMVLAGLAVILYVMWQLSTSIAAGSSRIALLLGAAFVAFFVAGRIAGDWRSGVRFFLVWLLFEDLVRKYMGNNMIVYFAKDVLVGVIYMSVAAAQLRGDALHFRPPFRWALGLFLLLGLAQVFNPGSPSLVYGLLGLKLYFYYIPLMFVGYAMLRTELDLRSFLFVNIVLAAVISLVGILQTIVGLDFLNPHGGEDIELLGHLVRVSPSGLLVARPPSVFVSDGRFAQYLILASILVLGTAGYLLLRPGRGRKLVFPSLGLVVLAATLSGGRGGFVYVVASTLVLAVGMLWGAPSGVGQGYRLVKAIRRSFIFVVLAVSLAVAFFPDVIGTRLSFYRETILPGRQHSEAGTRAWDYPVSQVQWALSDPRWAIGHGIGTASLGIQYVSRILEVPRTNIATESGYGIMILELGILGPILWLLWTSSLILAAYKVVLRLKGTWAFPVAFSILWFAFLLLFPMTFGGIQAFQNFVFNAYFWLLVGVLFRLPDLVNQNPGDLQVTSARAR